MASFRDTFGKEKGIVKFLLTSGGISNESIRHALVDLLGKPIGESTAVCIPTAAYSLPEAPTMAWWQIGAWANLGWKTFGLLELTALPSTPQAYWLPQLEAADALLVGGGESFYLCYWMRQSGVAARLPALLRDNDTVYAGASAGSRLVTATFGEKYDGSDPLTGSDEALGLVDFTLRPHLDAKDMPSTSLANLEKWAAGLDVPAYAIDDQTAIKVVDDAVEVVSEGKWHRFAPQPAH